MTTMTLELLKYLTEQLGLFLNMKQTKIKLAKNIKKGFSSKNFFVLMYYFIKHLCYFSF